MSDSVSLAKEAIEAEARLREAGNRTLISSTVFTLARALLDAEAGLSQIAAQPCPLETESAECAGFFLSREEWCGSCLASAALSRLRGLEGEQE